LNGEEEDEGEEVDEDEEEVTSDMDTDNGELIFLSVCCGFS